MRPESLRTRPPPGYSFTPITPKTRESVDQGARQLLARLDSAQFLSPDDHDIMALRVHYNVAMGKYQDGEMAARESCTTPVWMCRAFLGHSKYNAGRFSEAHTDFAASLELMPESKRCLSGDFSHVMNDREFTAEYRAVKCEQRADLNARIWWLSDPLWMKAGNERRLEHYSRWVTAEMLRIQAELLGRDRFRTDAMHGYLNALLRTGTLEWYGGVAVGCYQGEGSIAIHAGSDGGTGTGS